MKIIYQTEHTCEKCASKFSAPTLGFPGIVDILPAAPFAIATLNIQIPGLGVNIQQQTLEDKKNQEIKK